MNTARIGRVAKSKVFLYLCCILVLGTVIYVFHGTQSQLEDVKKAASICVQQQESLSAQLQVIFEYKLRLEKSLQKQKTLHKQEKDKLLSKLEEEKQLQQKENAENSNKLFAVQEKYALLQKEHNTLNDEFSELKNKQTENNGVQQNLKKQAEELKNQLKLIKTVKDQIIEKLKAENEALINDKQKLLDENKQLLKNIPSNGSVYNNEFKDQLKEVTNQLQEHVTPEVKGNDFQDHSGVEVQDNQLTSKEKRDSKTSMISLANKLSEPLKKSSTTPVIFPQAVEDYDMNHDSNNNNNTTSSAKPL